MLGSCELNNSFFHLFHFSFDVGRAELLIGASCEIFFFSHVWDCQPKNIKQQFERSTVDKKSTLGCHLWCWVTSVLMRNVAIKMNDDVHHLSWCWSSGLPFLELIKHHFSAHPLRFQYPFHIGTVYSFQRSRIYTVLFHFITKCSLVFLFIVLKVQRPSFMHRAMKYHFSSVSSFCTILTEQLLRNYNWHKNRLQSFSWKNNRLIVKCSWRLET